MKYLYTVGIYAYLLGISVASLLLPKAKKWLAGRKSLFQNLPEDIGTSEWVWIHAASLGEFEQGRPLIEMIKAQHPESKVLMTFFSPSGFEVRKDYPMADHVCYMPLDTPGNARRFVNSVNLRVAVFVKYELWYHHLSELQRNGIPVLLISAQFREDHFYFKWYGRFFLPLLQRIRAIFTADIRSSEILKRHNFGNSMVSGDTRVDRASQIASNHRDFGQLSDVLSLPIVVAGSTWPGDEIHMIERINRGDVCWVIAPHEIHERRLIELEERIDVPCARYSSIKPGDHYKVVLLDTMGDLAHVYHIAHIAYVGGGFDSGIHNTLEPAAYHIPVLFGPKYHRFAEAEELIKIGAGFSIDDAASFNRSLDQAMKQEVHDHARAALQEFFDQHQGATKRIYDYIQREKLL